MTFDRSHWPALLAGALKTPGAPYPDGHLSRDGGTSNWGRYNTQTWSAEQAFLRLGVQRINFPDEYRNAMAGFATADRCIGLNPRASSKIRTAAHELAHILHNHFETPAGAARVPVEEFEADCTALVVCHALQTGEADQADCRFYIQYHLRDLTGAGGRLPRTWADIQACALRILDAGAGRFVVTPEPKPLVVETSSRAFAAKIRLGSW